jgi:hypothetical protein
MDSKNWPELEIGRYYNAIGGLAAISFGYDLASERAFN